MILLPEPYIFNYLLALSLLLIFREKSYFLEESRFQVDVCEYLTLSEGWWIFPSF